MGMFSGFWRSADVARAIENVLDSKLSETVTALNSVGALTEQKRKLTEQVHGLGLQVTQLQDEIKREREEMQAEIKRERLSVEHKLGLEKMRQEQDAKLAEAEVEAQRRRITTEMELAVREARLEAQAAATEEAREQMGAFLDRQERMIDTLLGAVPSAQFLQRTGVPDVQVKTGE